MTAAGQAGFSEARYPKVSAFLRRPQQGLCSLLAALTSARPPPETGFPSCFHSPSEKVRHWIQETEAAGRVEGWGGQGTAWEKPHSEVRRSVPTSTLHSAMVL